jgi:hypothetical protein
MLACSAPTRAVVGRSTDRSGFTAFPSARCEEGEPGERRMFLVSVLVRFGGDRPAAGDRPTAEASGIVLPPEGGEAFGLPLPPRTCKPNGSAVGCRTGLSADGEATGAEEKFEPVDGAEAIDATDGSTAAFRNGFTALPDAGLPMSAAPSVAALTPLR